MRQCGHQKVCTGGAAPKDHAVAAPRQPLAAARRPGRRQQHWRQQHWQSRTQQPPWRLTAAATPRRGLQLRAQLRQLQQAVPRTRTMAMPRSQLCTRPSPLTCPVRGQRLGLRGPNPEPFKESYGRAWRNAEPGGCARCCCKQLLRVCKGWPYVVGLGTKYSLTHFATTFPALSLKNLYRILCNFEGETLGGFELYKREFMVLADYLLTLDE